MSDIFLKAAKLKLRFQSSVGYLAAEQLFELPLTSTKGPSLNAVAIICNNEVKALTEESFVGTPAKGSEVAQLKLDVVKAVIAEVQAENADKLAKADKVQKKARLTEALFNAENRKLADMDPEEIRKQIEAL